MGVLGRGATASSAALESDRYAVHAMPTVDTKGYFLFSREIPRNLTELTSWN